MDRTLKEESRIYIDKTLLIKEFIDHPKQIFQLFQENGANLLNSSPLETSPAIKRTRFNKVKTAIGVNSFKELVEESSIFIDKAMLIKEFMDHSAQVLLITCPRRWSKSINMDMIKTFFEIEADTNGNRYKDKTGSK